ncbi:MAG TPA: hypothetical protein VJB14_04105 [Planctomycetota bacterium]|nr:hypothetical protein [Planctomycetota bacterium]
MARRGKEQPEDEAVDEGAEEAHPAATEFVPEISAKPKSNVYSAILILTFCAFLAGCILSGREAWEHYDVQFWMFTKQQKGTTATSGAPTDAAPATNTGEAPKDPPNEATPPEK